MRRTIALGVLAGVLLGGAAAYAADSPPAATHLLLLVVKEPGGFRVEQSTLVPKPLPKQRDTKRVYPWRFEISNAQGKVVYSSGMADPTEIRGEFANPTDPTKIDLVRVKVKDPVRFTIRVPVQEATEIAFFALDETLGRMPDPPPSAFLRLGATSFPKIESRP
jgi:hypothetical protein